MKKSKFKILLVEDELAQIKILKEKFSKENFDVETAMDGQEGLKMALLLKPDLILTDILMPKMDGMAMLRELRKDRWGKRVKVILLTNLNDPEKIEEGNALGVLGFIVKSDWQIDAVVETVKKNLLNDV